jgi:hypothetical protein
MKLILVSDDGVILDEVEFTRSEWRSARGDMVYGATLLSELESDDDD